MAMRRGAWIGLPDMISAFLGIANWLIEELSIPRSWFGMSFAYTPRFGHAPINCFRHQQ
jgi:hypothetical protein